MGDDVVGRNVISIGSEPPAAMAQGVSSGHALSTMKSSYCVEGSGVM